MTPDSTLDHAFDMETRIQVATPRDTIKGMFLSRVEGLLTNVDGLARPRRLPFRDYPLTQYFRVVDEAAQALFPELPRAEAVRRVGGEDFREFAGSAIGRVSLALLGDVFGTLSRAGYLYEVVLKGDCEVTTWRDGDVIRMEYRRYPGPTEVYPIGTIESTCRYFGVGCEIEIDVLGPRDADYVVRPLTG